MKKWRRRRCTRSTTVKVNPSHPRKVLQLRQLQRAGQNCTSFASSLLSLLLRASLQDMTRTMMPMPRKRFPCQDRRQVCSSLASVNWKDYKARFTFGIAVIIATSTIIVIVIAIITFINFVTTPIIIISIIIIFTTIFPITWVLPSSSPPPPPYHNYEDCQAHHHYHMQPPTTTSASEQPAYTHTHLRKTAKSKKHESQ